MANILTLIPRENRYSRRSDNRSEAYLCTGTHDFTDPCLQLITKPIMIGKNSFIGARAMILPGVCIGDQVIVGAMSVVSKDVPDHQIVVGNPAKKIGERTTL